MLDNRFAMLSDQIQNLEHRIDTLTGMNFDFEIILAKDNLHIRESLILISSLIRLLNENLNFI
jgi:hypothetical protein